MEANAVAFGVSGRALKIEASAVTAAMHWSKVMKKYLLGTAALIALAVATPAAAADMGARYPMKAPPPVAQVWNWTGFYVGINGGYGWGESRWSLLPAGLNEEIWKKLVVAAESRPIVVDYTLREADVRGPFVEKMPRKFEALKDLPALEHASARERLAERFHISEALLSALNPGQKFERAGDTIRVIDVATPVTVRTPDETSRM